MRQLFPTSIRIFVEEERNNIRKHNYCFTDYQSNKIKLAFWFSVHAKSITTVVREQIQRLRSHHNIQTRYSLQDCNIPGKFAIGLNLQKESERELVALLLIFGWLILLGTTKDTKYLQTSAEGLVEKHPCLELRNEWEPS